MVSTAGDQEVTVGSEVLDTANLVVMSLQGLVDLELVSLASFPELDGHVF